MIRPQIPTRIHSLHNHLLARDRSARERQLIAGAAPATLAPTRNADCSKPIGQVVVDCPRLLVRAHVRCATVTAGFGIDVLKGAIVLVAGLDG